MAARLSIILTIVAMACAVACGSVRNASAASAMTVYANVGEFITDLERLAREIETADASAASAIAASLPDVWSVQASARASAPALEDVSHAAAASAEAPNLASRTSGIASQAATGRAHADAGAHAHADANADAGPNAIAATNGAAAAAASVDANSNARAGVSGTPQAAFTLHTDWIKIALRQAPREAARWPARRREVIARLDAVRSEAIDLHDAMAADAASTAAARTVLRDVLSRGEFTRNEGPTWADAVRQQMAKWIDALLDRLGVGRKTTAAVGRTLAWGVAIVALLALGFLLWRMRRARGAWQQLSLDAPPRLSSREWAARAADALRAGDAREAIRCGYHAALFRLEEQGVWRVDDARTPREYLSLLPRHDVRRVALVDLTRDFELAWYGSQAPDARGLLERLEVLGCAAPPSTIASS